MGNDKTRDIHYLSESNKSAILNLLRMEGPASRSDISRKLGLSFPAVSTNVKGLMEAGLLCEAGEASNALGRKGKLLAINADRMYFVGLDLGRRTIRAMCTDVLGKQLAFKRRWFTGPVAHEQVGALIRETVREAGVDLEEVAAIGVGVSGAPPRQRAGGDGPPQAESAEDAAVLAYLGESFTQRIYAENSANLGAVGECWKGAAQGCSDVVYLDLGVGFNAGIIQGGKLVRGKHNAAGSIGFMTVDRGFLRKQFNGEGSLEQLIPGAQINRILSQDDGSEDIDLDFVENELRSYLSPLFTDFIHVYFAMTVINVIALMDPEVVVISGRLGRAIFQKYEDQIRSFIGAHLPFLPQIRCSELREKANVYGAVALALDQSEGNFADYFPEKDA